jgi:peptidoglycan/xylan/chitin deacetylase (PgdA/CDA1 family)
MRRSYRTVSKSQARGVRPYLWIALAALVALFLSSPMPLPKATILQAMGEFEAAQPLPTAQMMLDSQAQAEPLIGLSPLVEEQTQAAALLFDSATASPVPPSPSPSELPTAEPSPTYAPPTRTPFPPTATLSPPLLIITSPPAPAITAVMELQPTQAAPPTLMPSLPPAQPAQAPANGPPAPSGPALYIPTLMYHYVRYVDPSVDPLGYNLSVTPENLAAQLDWIAQRGYTTVTMDTLMRCRNGGTPEQPCPAKPIALTFDDGYDDAYSQAFPALQQRGMVATFYIITNSVGHPMYMNWDQIRVMRAAGMEIGAHTKGHPDLTTLGIDQARDEIAGSKAIIEAELGEQIRSFCYPAGRFSGNVVNLVREAGFTNATTTMSDLPQSGDFLLPRIRIDGSHSLATFQSLVP